MVKRRIEEELSFTFRGEAVDDGSIPMSEYGRAVIGYSQMVRAAVREIDPCASVPDVRVTYQNHGSFITGVHVAVEVSLGEALMDWLASSAGAAVGAGLSMVADGTSVVGFVVGGSLAIGKWIRGRRIAKREKLSNGRERITLDDGSTREASTTIINVSINNYFRGGARDFISPTRQNGIDSVTFCGGGEKTSLTASDLHAFDGIDEDAEKIFEEDMTLEVIRPAFDEGPWRFCTVPIGKALPFAFSARILDDNFLDEVAAGEAFRKGDQIDANVRVTVPKKTGDRVRRRYEVLEVTAIHKARAIPSLFDDGLEDKI